ncbi:MAG: kelch repeat-containing protein [Thermomicrobiales bacterium]
MLTTGGDAPGGYLPAAELYDPATNRWEPATPMSMGRLYHTATLLPTARSS